ARRFPPAVAGVILRCHVPASSFARRESRVSLRLSRSRGKRRMRYLRLGLFAGALGSVLATDVSAVQAGDPGSHCAGGCGTVFSLDLNTGAEKVLHSFQKDGTDGTSPVSRLTEIGSMLYGTTETGGDRVGTVFAIDRRTGAESIVHTFTAGADGIYPEAGLKKMGGLLYGTTSYGGSTGCGSSGCGTVFSIDPATGKETVLHSFKGNPTDGAIPEDELIEVNGILYGTTLAGGSGTCDCGTVFSIDPATGEEKVLYSFTFGSDGAYPYARVTNVAGTLYGTTPEGGNSSNGGTRYSLDPATGRATVLYDVGSGGGSLPFSGRIEADRL